jgi:hypothetical protein
MNISELPVYISLLFAALVFAVAITWLIGISRAATLAGMSVAEKRKLLNRFSLALGIWLAITALMAMNGFLLETDSMPPKILLVVAPALIAGILISRSKMTARLLAALPTNFIIMAQSFRLGVEIIFYLLLINNAIPTLMTFEGRNMDIFVGLTAIPMAMLARSGKLSDRSLRVWNYAGLAILLNVMIHGMLSAPSPMQQITTVPVNNFMFHFPFVWLLALLVPSAFTGHLLSLRQLSLRRAHVRKVVIA